MNNSVEVKLVYNKCGQEGAGWYVWESSVEDEGYVLFCKEKPTEEFLKTICEDYVIAK